MSFVVFAGCKYFGVMLGERRCCDPEGNVVDENVKKVIRINDNIITCGAGNENIINLIFEYLNKNNDLTFDEYISLLNSNYHLIYQRLINIYRKNNIVKNGTINANLGIASIVDNIITFANGQLKDEYITINTIQHKTDNDITLCFLGTGLGSLGKYFSNTLLKENNMFSISNLKSIFYKTIKDNMDTDFTINDRIISEKLIRKDIYDERKDRRKN